jgi:hypothetical protein
MLDFYDYIMLKFLQFLQSLRTTSLYAYRFSALLFFFKLNIIIIPFINPLIIIKLFFIDLPVSIFSLV